nr:low-density lipoprotein receptor-related protein 4-like [Lytechinus pictus]
MIVTDPSTPYKIFLADLQEHEEDLNFTSIPSTMEASFVTYDTVEKKVYWTDTEVHQVYRADTDGENKEPVIHQAHAEENSRIIFIAKTGRMITTLDIRNGGVFPKIETDFVSGFASFPRALVVDEEQGFLYWSTKSKIERILLTGTGIPETVYHDVLKPVINGLSIDLSRMPRRIFFCYPHLNDSFYKDLTMPLDLYSASHLSAHIFDPDYEKKVGKTLLDITYFNDALYWSGGGLQGIVLMKDYEHSNRSLHVVETGPLVGPFQINIFIKYP